MLRFIDELIPGLEQHTIGHTPDLGAERIVYVNGEGRAPYLLRAKADDCGESMCWSEGDVGLVIAQGAAYVGRRSEPQSWSGCPLGPVMAFYVVPGTGVVLANFNDVGLIDRSGTLAWRTRNVSADGVRFVAEDAGRLHLAVSDGMTDDIEAAIDLRSGAMVAP